MSAVTRKAMLSYLRPYAAAISAITALQMLGVVMQLLTVGMLAFILDMGRDGYGYEYILEEGMYLLGMTAVFSASVYLATRLSSRVAAGVASDIRKNVLASALKVQSLDEAGDSATYAMTCVTSDAMVVQEHVFASFSVYLPLPVLAAAMVAMTYMISPTIGAMVLAAMAVAIVLTYAFSRHSAGLQADRIVGQDMVARSLREKVTGARTIKAYCGEEYETAKFSGISSYFGGKNRKAVLSSYYLPHFSTAFIWIFIVLVYMVAALGLSSRTVGLVHLVLFMQFTTCIVSSLAVIPYMCVQASRARASMERIIRATASASGEKPRRTARIESANALEVSGASFRDGFGGRAGGSMDFSVPKGKVVTLTGTNGCGITELIDCITAFSSPVSGKVSVCGMDVSESDPSDVRRSVSYAGRQSGVFRGTLRVNLDAAGSCGDARMLEVSRATGLIGFIEKMPDGLDSPVSSSSMSGGQAQLIALTRCLLRDAELYVLDDCFFSLDDAAKDRAIGAVLDLCRGKTVLFVSHEMTTVDVSDEVILIRDGKVDASGTHAELLSRSPFYSEMYGRCSGGISC